MLLAVLLGLSPTAACTCAGSGVQATDAATATEGGDSGARVWGWLQSDADERMDVCTRQCISLVQLVPVVAADADVEHDGGFAESGENTAARLQNMVSAMLARCVWHGCVEPADELDAPCPSNSMVVPTPAQVAALQRPWIGVLTSDVTLLGEMHASTKVFLPSLVAAGERHAVAHHIYVDGTGGTPDCEIPAWALVDFEA